MIYIVISIILILYSGINYYISIWFWKNLCSMIPFFNSEIYFSFFFIIFIISLVGVIWNRHLPKFLQDGVYLMASYWLAAIVYFAIFIGIIECFFILGNTLQLIPSDIKLNANALFYIALIVLFTVIIIILYGAVNAKNVIITPYNIDLPKKAGKISKLQIALLSDIHLGNLMDKRIDKLIDKINSIQPDIVLIAGDIIDSNRDMINYDFSKMQCNFQKIKSTYGIYACLGNHDYDHKGDSSNRIKNLKKVGVNILRDSYVKIDDSFCVIGREDISYERINGGRRKNLSETVNEISRELPIIVLDHQPNNLNEPMSEGIDLQLSGHTHKGQFFPFNLITKRVFKIDYGYLKMEKFQIIVSCGTRTWGPPIRIGSKCEIVNINVTFQ